MCPDCINWFEFGFEEGLKKCDNIFETFLPHWNCQAEESVKWPWKLCIGNHYSEKLKKAYIV